MTGAGTAPKLEERICEVDPVRTWYGFKWEGPCGVAPGSGAKGAFDENLRGTLGWAEGGRKACSGGGGEVEPAPSRAELAGCNIRRPVGNAEVESVCTGPGGDVASALPEGGGGSEAKSSCDGGGPEKLAGRDMLTRRSFDSWTPFVTAPFIPWVTVLATPATPLSVLLRNSLPLPSPLYGAHVDNQA